MPDLVGTRRNYDSYAYAGILLTVLYVLLFALLVPYALSGVAPGESVLFQAVFLLSVGVSLYFLWGFKMLGDGTGNRLLAITAVATMVASALLSVPDILSIMFTRPPTGGVIFTALRFIIWGSLYLLLGVAFYRSRAVFGGLASATGILSGIVGISYLSAPLIALMNNVITIAVLLLYILEVLLLFKASRVDLLERHPS